MKFYVVTRTFWYNGEKYMEDAVISDTDFRIDRIEHFLKRGYIRELNKPETYGTIE